MNRTVWIIIFSAFLAAAVAIVALVVVANRGPYIPVDLRNTPQPKGPGETKVSDERILRLEVQLKAPDRETRLLCVFELTHLAENNPERLGPVLLRALESEDAEVRFLVANKLGRIKYVGAAEALTGLLDDSDRGVSVQAVESLVKLDESGLKAAMEALAENKIRNIDGALDAISRISGRSFGLGKKGRRAALEYWDKRNSPR